MPFVICKFKKNNNVFKEILKEYHQNYLSNSLDPDKVRCFVGSDLGPSCLQMLSADNTGGYSV